MAVLLAAASVQAQCHGGGGGGSPGGSVAGGGGMSMGGSVGAATMLTGPGSWAYDQMLGQALARQQAQQRYQKALAEQKRRAESLAQRQYWAAQRREEKAKSAAAMSPGLLASSRGTSSMAWSLDFSPSAKP